MPCVQKIIPQNEIDLQELIVKIKNIPTLTMMMLTAWKLACLIVIKVVEEALAERANKLCQWPKCPLCGSRIQNKGREPRQIKTLVGIVRWKRKVGRCPEKCKIGQVVPLDKELGLTPNQRVCNDLKRVACALAVFVPYEIASKLLSLLTRSTITSVTIWNWVQVVGSKAMKKLENELATLQKGEAIAPEEMDTYIEQLPLLIGGDGVFVPLRQSEGSPEGKVQWREVKVGIFARLRQYVNTKGKPVTRLLKRRLVAVLGDKDDFRLRMELESKKQNIKIAETVVWISDGGRGFWNIFNKLFAVSAIGILDFYHAAQNLWKTAAARFDGRTKKAKQWFVRARHHLRHGQLDLILSDFEKTLDYFSVNDDIWQTVYNCHEYLDNHREHIRYPLFKDKLGLPIGSGMVESACKWLIQQRFKCVGMRWSRSGFSHLLHLRLAWVNERFDELFDFE